MKTTRMIPPAWFLLCAAAMGVLHLLLPRPSLIPAPYRYIVGGALIGIGGLLLSFLKAGKPVLSREKILRILPGLLLGTTACFVLGFYLA